MLLMQQVFFWPFKNDTKSKQFNKVISKALKYTLCDSLFAFLSLLERLLMILHCLNARIISLKTHIILEKKVLKRPKTFKTKKKCPCDLQMVPKLACSNSNFDYRVKLSARLALEKFNCNIQNWSHPSNVIFQT